MVKKLSIKERLKPQRKKSNPLFTRLDDAIALTRSRSGIVRYLFAFVISLLFLLLRTSLLPFLNEDPEFMIGLPAIFIVAWFAGFGPGILTTVVTALIFVYLFISPVNTINTQNLNELFRLFLYCVEGIFITGIIHLKNTAYSRMKRQTAQQSVIATLGQFGLEHQSLQLLLNRSIRAIQQTLGVDYVAFWEIEPSGQTIRLRTGAGWGSGNKKIRVQNTRESHIGEVLKEGEIVHFNRGRKFNSFSDKDFLEEYEINSGISIPLRGVPQNYGVLSVYSKEKRSITKDEITFVESIANVLQTTIERKESRKALEVIATASSEVSSTLDPKKALSNVVKSLVPQFADLSEIYVRRKGGKTQLVEVAAVRKEKERILREIAQKYPPHEAIMRPSGQVMKSGKALLSQQLEPDWVKDVTVDQIHLKLLSKLQVHSLIVVPLKIGRETIGVMTFGLSEQEYYYSENDFLVAKEIAGRVSIALENARLYEEVREAVQARDEFLSIASHELKTPLTSMLLQLQSVLHSIKNESLVNFSIDKTVTMLESTINQSKRLTKLVNDLLNISLITTGRMNLEKEEIDLNPIVKDVITRMEEQAQKTGSSIEFHADKAIKGSFDKVRIEQVIINLITNAIKYGSGRPIEVTLSNSNKVAKLAVKDNGMGIAQDQQKKIFERFERGDVKSSQKGLGVGLYMVNSIVKAHGGSIQLQSIPKKGSTFIVELPTGS